MDAAKIFSLFESGSNEATTTSKHIYAVPGAIEANALFEVSPRILVEMFIKMVAQVDDIVADIVAFLPEDATKSTQSKADRVQQYRYMCYLRALAYLDKLNLNNPTHLDYVLFDVSNLFGLALQKALLFFMEIEDYKVCNKLNFYLEFYNHSQRISNIH